MPPTIDLQKLARGCLNFADFYQKGEAAIQKPQKHFKQEQARNNNAQITNNCLTFGQFLARMDKQAGDIHV
jgi:hypothetical protein